MGLPVAQRLLAAGLTVVGYRRSGAPPSFLRAGGRAGSSPAEVAQSCPVVVTVLPSAQALASVISREHGLAAATRGGGVLIEMSTLPEEAKRAAARQLGERGWATLDCPISGQAVLFSSGPREAHDRVLPLLTAISSRVYYLGEFGRGTRAKYTAHLLLAGHSLVAAEALAFAHKAGLDLADVLAMLSGTIVSSNVFDMRGPRVLGPVGSHTGGAPLRTLAASLAELHDFAAQWVPTRRCWIRLSSASIACHQTATTSCSWRSSASWPPPMLRAAET
ncbi:MAG TPA: NAD(P)-dependent oxidoreductase [Mycobacterium sp.]|uniref:NAD(P)-dependent oxidoreductase n=1 Tax=Mycobacterium sp. TaxID=1785 RepID=UPI002C94B07C|nr:NAD(P)-dependent oxidoreductase [Mycobacterium sp.]HME74832.1 NAD(P)-dependent oxidoreductase [Mycobacterium sp.]